MQRKQRERKNTKNLLSLVKTVYPTADILNKQNTLQLLFTESIHETEIDYRENTSNHSEMDMNTEIDGDRNPVGKKHSYIHN